MRQHTRRQSPPQRRRDHRGHGRQRARRGAVGRSILALLDERPMHGYELLTALEERSGGRWQPSPGTIYPALQRLEHRGLVSSADLEGKRQYTLTVAGEQAVAAMRESGGDAPWDEQDLGNHGELRRALAELSGPARQIGRFGSGDQIATATAAIRDATGTLYRILADGPTAATPARPDTDTHVDDNDDDGHVDDVDDVVDVGDDE